MALTSCILCGSSSSSPCSNCGSGGSPFFPRAYWGASIAARYGARGGVGVLVATGDLVPPAQAVHTGPGASSDAPGEVDADMEAAIRARVMAEVEAREEELARREARLGEWERLLKETAEEAPPPRLDDLPDATGGEEGEAVDHTAMATSRLEGGDLEGAAAWFRKAAHSGDASAWMNLAEVLISLDRPEDAVQAYDAAIIRDPADTAALIGKFSLQVNLRSMVQAVETGRLLLKMDPESTRHVAEIAGALEHEGRREDAVTLYNMILEVEPDNPLVQAMTGILLSEMGDTKAAEEHVDAALEHAPNGELGWFAKGVLLNAQGRWGAAVQHLDRALSIRWDFPEAWMAKGEIHIGMGNHGEAADCFRRVLERRPGDRKATLGLAESLAKLGRRKEALAILQRLPDLDEDEGALFLKRMLEADDSEESLPPAGSGALSGQGDTEAWMMKGRALMDMGETGKAVECFNLVLEMDPEHEAAGELRAECVALLQSG